ncbi:dihydrodipicolinate synthase family protein [Alkalihalobacterium alkalinitrilicum]|uniref:dihydrodipicolinate synthase family protein n=1 Tax=Alkalihalobacterium alkalinitrilicum TaxID=427920 RepID=UPI0009954703|nr:dihydrodipicolinate synthase family protein [Alkalihalobacterium alkalinitrilicum]
MEKLEGIYPILATPFTSTGEVDYKSFKKLVKYLANSEVHGVTMFGIASEFHKLSDCEKDKMVEIAIKCLESKKTLIISITDQSWEVAIKRAKRVEAVGGKALMVFPPYFLSPSKKEIENHILKVAKAVQIPIIVQYAPNQSGMVLEPDFFANLNEMASNIQYVKVECVPPGPMITEISKKTDKISSLVGYAGLQMIDALDRGAAGVQPGCSFVEAYINIYNLYQSGEREKAVSSHQKLLPLLNLLMQNVELIIQAEKEILYRRGIISSPYCRSPKYIFDHEQRKQLDQYLEPLKEIFK